MAEDQTYTLGQFIQAIDHYKNLREEALSQLEGDWGKEG